MNQEPLPTPEHPGNKVTDPIICHVVGRCEINPATDKLELTGYYNGVGFVPQLEAAFHFHCVNDAADIAQRLRNDRRERYLRVYVVR